MKRSDPFVLELCQKHQVYTEYDEPRRLSSGIYSKKFYDMEKLYQNMQDYAKIAFKLFYITEESANVVAGCGNGGIPLATIIATDNGLKLTTTEKHPKGNYEALPVGGYKPKKDDRVLLVDDVLTTGGTFRNMKRDVEATGAQVVEMAAILNRNEVGLEEIDGISVRYLVRAEDLTLK
jgi:orotate phosphoribosyltransferase